MVGTANPDVGGQEDGQQWKLTQSQKGRPRGNLVAAPLPTHAENVEFKTKFVNDMNHCARQRSSHVGLRQPPPSSYPPH
ncbi:hypothetical protein R1flu_015429 [Riccia fluitans]|uniref:Uncharacterized protein n=1 Tax=Riccia fluitans TaxID=41844 RepID=A0ABD1YJB9_9MARC